MKALITGASSGLGKSFAINLSNMGYDIILVGRNKDKLEEVKKELKTSSTVINTDLSVKENVINLFNQVKEEQIDILINNAGFGIFGLFNETSLSKELELISTNITAVHILTKLFLQKFNKQNRGYILNVASSVAFMPGALMSSYYASKSYVKNLTCAIYEENKKTNSNVKISVLCPGPVNTNFNNVAGVSFSVKAMESNDVTSYALKKMFKNKLLIIPGIKMKLLIFFTRFIPLKPLLNITYKIQKSKKQ